MKNLVRQTLPAVVLFGLATTAMGETTPALTVGNGAAPPAASTAPSTASTATGVDAQDPGGVTSLMKAAMSGDVKSVQQALGGGADVNAQAENGVTALIAAQLTTAGDDQTQIVTALIAKGADVNAKDDAGWTPLLFASSRGNAPMCRLLMEHGADANVATAEAPLASAPITSKSGASYDQTRQSIVDYEVARAKAEKHAFWENLGGAVLSGVLGGVAGAVIPGPALINQSGQIFRMYQTVPIFIYFPKTVLLTLHGGSGYESEDAQDQSTPGRTPVYNAVASSDIDTVSALLEKGGNPNTPDGDGVSPLQLATEEDRYDIGALLVQHGATPRNLTEAIRYGTIDDVNRMVSACHDINGYDEFGQAPLHVAAAAGRNDVVTVLLAKGANINGLDSRHDETALYFAAEAGHTDTVQLLLSRGAALSPKGASDVTPLHGAASGGHADTTQFLIGAREDVNAKAKLVGTPLEMAIRSGDAQTAKVLLDHGANVDLDGSNDLGAAAARGNLTVVGMLLDRNVAAGDAVYQATRFGHLDVVKLLLDKGLSPSGHRTSESHRGPKALESSPLHAAAETGNVDLVNLLLSHGSGDINEREWDDSSYPAVVGRTPLGCAVESGHIEAAKVLIAHGADINAPYLKDDPRNLLQVAAAQGTPELIGLLLDSGLTVSQAPGTGLETPLHVSAQNGNTAVAALLIQRGAPLEALDSTRQTPLGAAAASGSTDCVELLLDKGANPNPVDANGRTPLHLAALSGNGDVVSVLLGRGASSGAVDNDKLTPVQEAVHHDRVEAVRAFVEYNPAELTLEAAALLGKDDDLRHFISLGGDCREAGALDETPLHKAAAGGSPVVVQTLLSAKADPNAEDKAGFSPLDVAALEGQVDAAKVLVASGARVDGRDKMGGTPLLWAVFADQPEVARFLLDSGANPNVKSKDGRMPLEMAASHGDLPLVRALVAHGVAKHPKDDSYNMAIESARIHNHNEVALFLERALIAPSDRT